jgi:hypothetical protein
MQKLQRKMGGFGGPRSDDDAQVSVLLKEFEEGDKLLKIVRLAHAPSSHSVN